MDIARDLSQRLDNDLSTLDLMDRYFQNKVGLEYLAPELKEATKGRLKPLALPWPRVVVSAIKERLNVTGFRIGENAESGLWQLWQASNLDEFSAHAHEDALVHGRSFVMVWADDQGQPRITVESAKQCHVQFRPGSRVRQYAIRRWRDNDNARLDLFTPDEVIRFSAGKISNLFTDDHNEPVVIAGAWEQIDTIPNPLGTVPLVPLVNRPRTLTPYGTSELADLLELFDAINKPAHRPDDRLRVHGNAPKVGNWFPSARETGCTGSSDRGSRHRCRIRCTRRSHLDERSTGHPVRRIRGNGALGVHQCHSDIDRSTGSRSLPAVALPRDHDNQSGFGRCNKEQ